MDDKLTIEYWRPEPNSTKGKMRLRQMVIDWNVSSHSIAYLKENHKTWSIVKLVKGKYLDEAFWASIIIHSKSGSRRVSDW